SDSDASVCIQPSQVEKSLLRSSHPSLCRGHLGQCRDESTLSNTNPLYELDPKFELTLSRLRKARKIVANNSSSLILSNIFGEPGQMENNDKTLKELATPDVRGPPQAFERIPRGLFHNETAGDSRRLYQDEGIPILA
ncbi:hypothetical protein CR513_00611, partial [Mucuna pruriens]